MSDCKTTPLQGAIQRLQFLADDLSKTKNRMTQIQRAAYQHSIEILKEFVHQEQEEHAAIMSQFKKEPNILSEGFEPVFALLGNVQDKIDTLDLKKKPYAIIVLKNDNYRFKTTETVTVRGKKYNLVEDSVLCITKAICYID